MREYISACIPYIVVKNLLYYLCGHFFMALLFMNGERLAETRKLKTLRSLPRIMAYKL